MSNAQNYPQVLEFLRQCDLLEYYDRLISEGFDQMRSLFDITEMDLIAMNVKRGHRRRIQREIATMKGIPTSQPLHIQSEPGSIGDYSSSTTSASTNLSTSMTNPGKNIIPTIAAAPGSSIPVLIDGPNGGRSRGFDYNNNYGYSYNNNVGESCARHQPPNLPPLNHSQQSFYNNNNESSFQRQIALTLSKPSTMTTNQPSRNIAATAAYTTAKFNSNNDQYSSSYPLPNKTNLNLTLNNPNDPNNNEDANNNNGKRKYKRHPKRDKNAPVKPLSAYVMFSHKVREEYQGKNISFPDMAKIVGDRWKSIPAEEKEMIENEAAKAKEEYLAAMTVYKTTDKWKQYQEYLKDFKEKHDPNYRESNKGRKRSKFNVNSPDSDQTTNSGYSSTRSTSLGYVSSGSSNNGNSNGTHNGNNGSDGSSNQNNSNIRNIHNIHNNNDINNSNKNYTSVATTNFSSSLPSSSKNNNKNNNDNNNDNNNNNNNYIPPYAHSNPTMPFYNHRNNKTTGSSTTTTSTFANISSNSNASTSISTNNSSTNLSPNINNTSLSGLLIHPKDCDKKKSDDNNNSNCDGDNSGRHSNSNSDSNSDSDNGNDNDNQVFEDFTISNNFGSSSTNTTSSPNNESFDGGNNNQNQNSLIDQEEEQQQQQQQQQPSSSSSISPSSSLSSSFSSSSQ